MYTKKLFTEDINKKAKPSQCVLCPLYSKEWVTTKYFGNSYPDVWIVGNMPDIVDIQTNSILSPKSPAGGLLSYTLNQIGWNLKTLFTNACLCFTDRLSVTTINKCTWHLDKISTVYKTPKLIIALGISACKALGIQVKKIEDARRQVFESKYGPVFVTYHPGRIVNARYKLRHLFAMDIALAFEIAKKGYNKTEKTIPNVNIKILTDQQEIVDLLESVPSNTYIAFDYETALPDSNGNWPEWGLDPYHPLSSIYVASIAFDNKAYSFPVNIKDGNNPLQGNPEIVKKALANFLKNNQMVAHNSKFETLFSQIHLNVTPNIVHDTQILAYLIRESMQGYYSLESLAKLYLPDFDGFKKIKLTNIYEYNALDSFITIRLLEILMNKINSMPQKIKETILEKEKFILKYVVPIIVEMKKVGFKVDREKLSNYIESCGKLINKIESLLINLTQVKNHRSNEFKNYLVSLCKKEGIPVPFTNTGLPSITKDFIASTIKENNKLTKTTKEIFLYKNTLNRVEKAYNSYLKPYENFINPTTGRIHPSYNETGTVTGRLSSENPNFQQIPKHGIKICTNCNIIPIEEEHCPLCKDTNFVTVVNIVDLISPSDGYKIVDIDYSQMEIRVLSWISKDENLCKVLKQGMDLHSYTVSKINKIPYDYVIENKNKADISKLRRDAKSVTFGIIYGITPKGLSARLSCTETEASDMIHGFFNTYPGVKQLIDEVHAFVKKNKYIICPTGRIRHFDVVKRNELREAQNFIIQASATDIALYGAYKCMEYLNKEKKGRIIGFVHDSIVLEVSSDSIEQTVLSIKEILTTNTEKKFGMTVPLDVDIKIK